jgi:hypothetical protein
MNNDNEIQINVETFLRLQKEDDGGMIMLSHEPSLATDGDETTQSE